MQVEIKEINGVSKQISLRVEPERVDQSYQIYLAKAARSLEVPGFRKGKAPLAMVQKAHGERIRDYFEKDFIDEIFYEAATEYDIHFLLAPEVKELTWIPGSEMTILFEIEHEPKVEFVQLSGLQIPRREILLEDEVERFIAELAKEQAVVIDVDVAEANDQVNLELSFDLDGEAQTHTVEMIAGEEYPQRSLAALSGTRTGDRLNAELTGKQLKLLCKDSELALDNDAAYPCALEVNSISRYSVPAIDDEFAKDMDFADMAEMRAKIGEDLRLKVEHRNLEIENSAIIVKLFTDNKFPLPPKTLRYILEDELKNADPRIRDLLFQYYAQNLVQEMTSLYIMQALRKQQELELTDALLEQYIEHLAILDDVSAGAFKEKEADRIASDDFRIAATNFHILRDLAAANDFIEAPDQPEPEPVPEPESPTQEEHA